MSEDSSCISCKFSKFYDKGYMWERGQGYCRRYAPKPVVIRPKELPDGTYSNENLESVWPIVSDCDFCGEFMKI